MNTESNTMTTDLTNVDPALYTVLKKKQQEFIHILDRECGTDAYEMTRGTLKKIANDNGIAWAPAWIVKDISRAVKRGTYRVPELAAYRNYRDGLEADAIESDHTVIVEENVPMVESILA
tara:strand:+ start:1348 stop:1707 length:360 start_codon:yes stop_codon:yes gene_type:complete